MPFNANSTYAGAIAAGDTGSANLINSLYLQSSSFAELPNSGNAGVMAWPSHTLPQGPGAGYFWACPAPSMKREPQVQHPPSPLPQSLQEPGWTGGL